MQYLLRLPRWLAGALLLFTLPACALQPAVAFSCATVDRFRSQYSETELRDMAKAHGYSDADIAQAEKCFTNHQPKSNAVTTAKPKPDIEVTKRSPTLPPVRTLPTPAPAPAASPAVAPVVEAPAPVVIEQPAPQEPPVEPVSWFWEFIQYLGMTVVVVAALGIIFSRGRSFIAAYRAGQPSTTA